MVPEGIGYGVGVRVGVGVNVLVGVAVRVGVAEGVGVREGTLVGVGLAGRKPASSSGLRVGAGVALGSARAISISVGAGVGLLANLVQPVAASIAKSANRFNINMAQNKNARRGTQATPGNPHPLEAASPSVGRIDSRLALIISGELHHVNGPTIDSFARDLFFLILLVFSDIISSEQRRGLTGWG